MRISDWSSDVCSSDLADVGIGILPASAAQRCARVMDIRVAALKDGWAVRQSMICARNVASLPLFTRTLIAMLTQAGDTRRSAEPRSEEHTSELQSLMRISYAVFCLKKKNNNSNPK